MKDRNRPKGKRESRCEAQILMAHHEMHFRHRKLHEKSQYIPPMAIWLLCNQFLSLGNCSTRYWIIYFLVSIIQTTTPCTHFSHDYNSVVCKSVPDPICVFVFVCTTVMQHCNNTNTNNYLALLPSGSRLTFQLEFAAIRAMQLPTQEITAVTMAIISLEYPGL